MSLSVSHIFSMCAEGGGRGRGRAREIEIQSDKQMNIGMEKEKERRGKRDKEIMNDKDEGGMEKE